MSDRPFPPNRSTEHVPIVHNTPFVVFTLPWAVRPPRSSLTVVVKATYALATDGAPLEPAEEQRPPDGDRREGTGDLGEALTYASDFAVLKPKADITLSGYGYPSEGGDGTAGLVELEVVDTVSARLALFGPRRWDALGAQTAPQRFERVPLSYTRAYGGPGYDPNPVGLGRSGDLLPQLEQPHALVRSRDSRAMPACFAPVAAEWPARRRHLGSYGRRWLAGRWPYFPDDFDWRYFNAAPEPLQVAYLRGDEAFRVRGVRPEGAVVQGRLPGSRVRVFAVRSEGGEMVEAPTHLDTLHIDAEAMEAVICWRAVLEVGDIDASELSLLFVTQEPLAEVRSSEAVREALKRALDEAGDETEESPPASRPLPAVLPVDRAQVVALLAADGAVRGAEWAGADLTGLDLSGRDLSGAVLTAADLRGADLSEAILIDARLDRVRAVGIRLTRADLTAADLGGADLTDADLDGARLEGATLDRATLNGAHLVGAKASMATLVDVSAVGASFATADLVHADLSSARLEGAVFRAARLDDAIFYDTDARSIVLDDAIAADLRCDGANMAKASLERLDAPGASFEGADLSAARLRRAILPRANFARAKLAGAVADGCDLRRSTFRKADLTGASLAGSDLMQADFDHAVLRKVDLRDSNLHEAETWGAALEGARLDGALVTGSKLEDRT